ncbi:helix-turn-helix transcriptional regulator [Mycobacterium aquaticum]|uniref:LuxR family transcriptional regulator n=1 Tax=Mycobacterium aquaticum TaxID=1927124 RepID=A0A1X0ADY9_9MYCO|nr:AAA family ATPase [Mycobacterium aquaticum]ORA28263.1 LuxR family transcriptional regulator [Mycobacterium aquaticum]
MPDVGGQRLGARPIRGRVDELRQIGTLTDAVAHGRGGVLVIEGPPGIGKSRLLTEVTALAEKNKARILFGEAFEYQQSVPFFSLFTATLGADPPVGDAEALRALGSSADVSYWVVHDLQRAIDAAAAETPLVIALEDIHWADTSTLLALRSLTSAHPDVPVLWVLTVRTGAGGPVVHETLTVLRRTGATVLQIPAMSPDAVTEMVQDAVRAGADETLLSLAVKAHGNPFLVMELVGGLAEEGRLDIAGGHAAATGVDLPRRLGASMQQRLDVLSSGASELVRVASVLPDRFSATLLAAMLDRQPASLMTALAEAVQADLLVDDGEQLRFGHDLLREATRQSLPRSLRRAMERQSASIMLSMGATPAEVATQLARSADPGDTEAIGALRQAARTIGRSDANAAADLSRRALELTPSADGDHGRLVAETVALLNRANRYREAEELALAAMSGASAEDEAQIRLRLPSFTTHSTQRRVEENRRALQLRDISDVTRARHLAWLAYNLMRGNRELQRAGAEEAAAAAASTGDLEATIVSELTLACLDWQDGYAGRAVRRLDELSKVERTGEAITARLLLANNYANLLAVVGRLDDAAKVADTGMERARQEHNSMALDIWAANYGGLHLAAGRLVAARSMVESLPEPSPAGATELDMMRTVTLAQVALHTDDRKLLQQMVAYAHDAYTSGAAMVRRTAGFILALAAWHRNDLHGAMQVLGAEITPYGSPQTIDHALLCARVAAAAGDAGLRANVLRGCDLLERETPTVPLFAAVATYARSILESDPHRMLTAAELLRSSSRPLLHAAAAEDAATLLIAADRTEEGINHFNAAFDTYTRLEAPADARRIGRALRGLGVERRIVSRPRAKSGWDSLTDAEIKVVSLIAEGGTNRAVADQLHISLYTVKTHAHNAFAKLGINSRSQLTQRER